MIGVVTGLAAAAGCQLVSSCDLVLATPTARFSTPGASVGLFCHTPGIPLARKEMMLMMIIMIIMIMMMIIMMIIMLMML